MLPNHAPLLIAEQFGTLAALHPGRIDLGLGRAPGSDQIAARAMRRNLAADVDQFPAGRRGTDAATSCPAEPGQVLQAVPGAGEEVEVWILGSSTFGAQLAAHLGLPYAFASHFAPGQMQDAVAIYRERFRAVGAAGTATRHARRQHLCGRHRCRGAAAVLFVAAGVPEPAARATGKVAAAGG